MYIITCIFIFIANANHRMLLICQTLYRNVTVVMYYFFYRAFICKAITFPIFV